MPAATSVIVGGARTPMGRLLGSLKDFSATDLGGFAIKAALERSGVSADQVQYVIMGQVLTAGAGQIPARQAAHKAGIPLTVPASRCRCPPSPSTRSACPVLMRSHWLTSSSAPANSTSWSQGARSR